MGMNVVWSGEISLNDFLRDSFPSPFRVSAPQALSLPPTTILAFFVVAGGHWGDTTASWLWAGPQQPEAPQPPPRPGMRLCPPAHATGRPRALPGEGDVELRPRAGVLSAVKTLYKLKIRLVGVETYSPRRRSSLGSGSVALSNLPPAGLEPPAWSLPTHPPLIWEDPRILGTNTAMCLFLGWEGVMIILVFVSNLQIILFSSIYVVMFLNSLTFLSPFWESSIFSALNGLIPSKISFYFFYVLFIK